VPIETQIGSEADNHDNRPNRVDHR
jgi:hypothetical protein